MTDTTASTVTGGEGTTATTTAPATPTTTTAPATPTTTTTPAWYNGADEVTVGYVQNKGWANGVDAVKSYQNLEKLLGADKAGNAVILPKPDATPEERAAFFNKLGRPADATGYKIAVPEGGDTEFAKTAGTWFHELGLTQKQGEALATKWNEHIGGLTAAQQAAKQATFDTEDAALKTAWGGAFQQNLTAAQAAARGLGLDAGAIDKLQASLGHKGTMEFLHKIGSKMGESDFVSGDNLEKFGNALTPGQAKSRISDLMRDKTFTAKYLSRDAEAKAEMERLHKFAYPEAS